MATDFGKTDHVDTLDAEDGVGRLLESLPDALLVADAHERVVQANQLACALFAYAAGELRGLPLASLLPGGGHTGLRQDGIEFPVEVRRSTMPGALGPLQLYAVRDITELVKAGQAKDRFLASMSHELRTPLNAILGFTGTMLMQLPGPLNEEQEKQLRTVQSSARHLLSLINDLLDLTKLGSGKVELHLEPLNCRSIVEELALVFRPQARQKGLLLQWRAPQEALMLRTDRRALQQILMNLMSNAIKVTERGGINIGLERSYLEGQSVVQVSVSDTGGGITEDSLQQLGIHLSHKLAALLNGSIRYFDKPGNGSIFVLSLPVE